MKLQLFATTPKLLESLLADELVALGAGDIKQTVAGVRFTGSLELAYRSCLWSRIANRILLELAQFPADSPQTLYAGIQSIDWQQHFSNTDTFVVTFNTTNSEITHSRYGAQKVKDAIVDQFRDATGERPSVELQQADIHINVYLLRNQATVSLDLSGDSLHLRGYRREKSAAPLKENLAAAILLRADWPEIAAHGGNLVDPMCGAGTLLIEAALMAADIAPGLARRHWGFTAWRQHDADIWQALTDDATQRRAAGIGSLPSIRGSDNSRAAINAALKNIASAGLEYSIHVDRLELSAAAPGKHGDLGLLVVNPPYGERLGNSAELVALYRSLGKSFKDNFPGWRAALLTGSPELGKKMGLRARRMHAMYNGSIECKLLHFDISPEYFVEDRTLPRPLSADQRGDGAQMFANRLQKNRQHLKSWLKRENIHCYRLYDADLPEYAVAIDVYESDLRRVHVQEYAAPASVDPKKARLRLREALGVILEVLAIEESELYFKVRRQQKGSDQYEKLSDSGRNYTVMENDLQFWVNFEDHLDTGLFLDHRLTRQRIGDLAAGKRFLNLFAYTGTATVYAAKAGALETVTVDMSNTYLDWARRNLALNKLTGSQHEFVRDNCLEWIIKARRQPRYDLIFLDPPSFSSSRRMQQSFDIQRDHVELIWNTMRLLEPDGTLIFTNNMRRFKLEHKALGDLVIDNISRSLLPQDFKRNPKIHHCWQIHWPAKA